MNKSDDCFKCFDSFRLDYNEKRYKSVVDRIPQFLKFQVTVQNSSNMKAFLVHSILAMEKTNSMDLSAVKNLCIKYHESIKLLTNRGCALKCLEFFNYLNLLVTTSSDPYLPKAVDKTWLDPMITMVMEEIKDWSIERTQIDRKELKKFIIVVARLESLLNEKNVFCMTKAVLKYFKSKMCTKEQIKSGWPDLLIKAVTVCELRNDKNVAANSLLENVRNLASDHENKWRKDIAIMMSQIFVATLSRLSKNASLSIIQIVIQILGIEYNVIRDKSLTSELYWSSITTDCCDRSDKHLALNVFESIRTFLIRAMERDISNDSLISTCVNFFTAELSVLDNLDCRTRSSLLVAANKYALDLSKHFNVTKSNRERGIRTITKILSVETEQEFLGRYQLLTKLIELTTDEVQREKLLAVRVLYAHPTQLVYAVHQLHTFQSEQPISAFKTIVTILNKLDGVCYGMRLKFDPLNLLFLQLKVQINYPKLNTNCAMIIIKEIRTTSSYTESQVLHVNLIKATVRIVEYMCAIKVSQAENCDYKMLLPFASTTKTINIGYEGQLLKLLTESTDYFAKFLSQKKSWTTDDGKEENISHMVQMLYRVGIWLMCHQFKASAIKTFNLLYEAATIAKDIIKQTIAAGFLIENDSLMTNPSMTNVLSTNIMKKLRSVDDMTLIEKTDFLLAILHLAMADLRSGRNIAIAKKYMLVVNKLLDTHDPEKKRFCSVRLKYCHIMFEMILRDPDSTITPMVYSEDIFHRFKSIKYTTAEDNGMLPAILFDIVNSMYKFTEARREFKKITGLIGCLWSVALYRRFVFMLSKVIVICTSQSLYTENEKLWKIQLDQLDTLFGSIRPCSNDECLGDAQDGFRVPKTKSKDRVSCCIHDINCCCLSCQHDTVHLVMMEIASLRAQSNYCQKEYEKSLNNFNFLYGHWQIGTNSSPYVKMLLMYSDCLNVNGRKSDVDKILFKATQSCNDADYNDTAQLQDIEYRMSCNNITKESLQIVTKKPYADFVRNSENAASESDEEHNVNKKVTRPPQLKTLNIPSNVKSIISPTSKVKAVSSTPKANEASKSKIKATNKRGIR